MGKKSHRGGWDRDSDLMEALRRGNDYNNFFYFCIMIIPSFMLNTTSMVDQIRLHWGDIVVDSNRLDETRSGQLVGVLGEQLSVRILSYCYLQLGLFKLLQVDTVQTAEQWSDGIRR